MTDGNRVYPVSEGFIHHSTGPDFDKGEPALSVQDWFSTVGQTRGYTDKNGNLIASYHEHPGRPGVQTYAMAHWALRHGTDKGNGYDGWELVELIKDPWHQVGWSVGNWNHNQKSVSIEVCGNWLGRQLPDEALRLIADHFKPQDQALNGGFTIWAHMWVYQTACPGALVNEIPHIVQLLNSLTPVPTPAPAVTPPPAQVIPNNVHTVDYLPVTAQVTTVSEGAKVRALPTTQSDSNQGSGDLNGGVTISITGITHGEDVAWPGGNHTDLWVRSIRGNWIWAGATTDLPALEAYLPKPAPAPTPVETPVEQPAIQVEPPTLPAEPTGQPAAADIPITITPKRHDIGQTVNLKALGSVEKDGKLFTEVFDFSTGQPVELVPDGLVLGYTSYIVVDGINYFQTDHMKKTTFGIRGLDLAYATEPTGAVDSVNSGAEPEVVTDALESVGKIFKAGLKTLDALSGKNKEVK